MRVGIGYDAHRLSPGKKLILGGVEIPFGKGLVGHSDADVLVHAIIDALFGAAGKGDIGTHFPDTDDRYDGVSSIELLRMTHEFLKIDGYSVVNIDAVVVCEAPKIYMYTKQMKKSIADALGINESLINIKGKTEESLGFTGRGEGIKVEAVCLLEGGDFGGNYA